MGYGRIADLSHRLDDNPSRGQQEHGRNDGCRDRLGLAVSVRVFFIRRFRRDHHASPDDNRTENI